ncbi:MULTISPECIES: PTS sugar transporter subunit IIC [Clostridium]|uniref:Permease IIC component n=1 Tax=Clostridium disporicum TaxID=84024 RepID=A0A174I1S2_9CLOT|nr:MULTISPECIES: PTS transporter subunit EIIC [Clostridium]MCD2502773.1 PTS transporter subunit EIIC [Clostridium sp. NSJ-145]CUO79308.1 cellobiose permease IIC component CelB [Clostridium disporicum]
MSFFDKFQSGIEKVMGPFANVVSTNKFIRALTAGFMATMPISLGTAAIAVLGNLPITPWQNFLVSMGLYQVAQDFISLTLSLLAIYVVISISYNYTKIEGKNAITGAVVSAAVFITLMPIKTSEIDGVMATSLLTSNMGSNGIFVAMIVGLLTPWIFCKLMNKNLKLKLPDSVPPMVADSLAPTFVAMILFFGVFMIKWGISLTSYGDIFTFITEVISKPVMYFGTSPWALIFMYCFMNLCWFFGIHPSPILSCYIPVLMAAGTANTEAFLAGQALPYLTFSIVGAAVYVGGNGNTLGLCIATLFAKSEKYKSMRKLVIPANIFNINEPIIFGFPTMLNPLYFIPMVFTSLASGAVAILLVNILPVTLNPTISLPWVTPGFVSSVMSGGLNLLLIWGVSVTIHFLMYLPFFMVDDANAYKDEQEMLKASEIAAD